MDEGRGRRDELVTRVDGWRFAIERFHVDRLRVVESLAALVDEGVGSRGLPVTDADRSRTASFVDGVFDDGDVPALLPGPWWNRLTGASRAHPQRVEVDLEHGLVRTESGSAHDRIATESFIVAGHRATAVLTAEGPCAAIRAGDVLVPPADAPPDASASGLSVDDPKRSGVRVRVGRHEIVAAADQQVGQRGGRCRLERVVTLSGGAADDQRGQEVLDRLSTACAAGVDRLRADHVRAWLDRWEGADTSLAGDDDLTLATRFAIAHLLTAARPGGSSAIGARGLTGTAYRGHVFWDTDVFVVPALAALRPDAARAALVYRADRLPAACERARAFGRSGARFPWESADDGRDVTPTSAVDLSGATVAIRTGEMEEHIVADVAWAVLAYHDETGDDDFMREHGDRVLVECARYWASRVEEDGDGSLHIRHVIGPDEYHEDVDDNAFTNVMAGWTLRSAAKRCTGTAVSPTEGERWVDLAERIVDGFDPTTGRHEQFSGFSELEPVFVASLGEPPLSADVLVGHDRIQRLQIVKQPDVLMLHHMIPDEVAPNSLGPDLDHYLPRTAHGSSLSPPIMAGLLARAGRVDEAAELFELAAFLDLRDLTGTTAGGLHLATMGGLWQAFHRGMLGMRWRDGALGIDPSVPPQWGRIEHRCRVRGALVRVEVDDDRAAVDATRELELRAGGGERRQTTSAVLRREREGWVFG